MSRHSVEESAVHDLTLDREDRACPECGRRMHVRCRRVGSILTLNGPLRLSVRLVQCCDERCEHTKLHGAAQESGYAMPRWAIDAHSPHPGVFTEDEPVGFATATAHAGQLAFHQRHGVMQKARSKKANPAPESTESPYPESLFGNRSEFCFSEKISEQQHRKNRRLTSRGSPILGERGTSVP